MLTKCQHRRNGGLWLPAAARSAGFRASISNAAIGALARTLTTTPAVRANDGTLGQSRRQRFHQHVQRMGVLVAHNHPSVSAFPGPTAGSACTLSFSRLAQRSLTLRPTHSHGHLYVTLSEGFRHFVTSMPAPVASGWSGCLAALAPAGEAPPFHGARGKRPFGDAGPMADLRHCRSAGAASLAAQRDGLFKIGARIGSDDQSIIFLMAEVVVSRGLFQ
jgi:hypothetical protein